MNKCGLTECIPRRKNNSNARSLLAKTNRDMHERAPKPYNFTPALKREMMGRLLQIVTIVLMSSSCYSFAGEIHRQTKGAGIGERGSACVARTIMSLWDKLRACCQNKNGLFCPLFIRYVDDIRIYLHPIAEGWAWSGQSWTFDPDLKDGLSFKERTKECILKH